MGYHHEGQNGNDQGIVYQSPGSDPSTFRAMKCQRIFESAGVWYKFNHDDGTTHTVITEEYIPDFTVRYLKVEGSNGNKLQYDMPMHIGVNRSSNQTNVCVDQFAVDILHKIHVTRVVLGGETNVNVITLFA